MLRSALLLCIFALLAGCTRGEPAAAKPEGGKFFALAAADVRYATPAGWRVLDPPLHHEAVRAGTSSYQSPGAALIFVQHNIAQAAFYPDDRTVIAVAVQGPWREYDGSHRNPLIWETGEDWDDMWWEGPIVTEKQRFELTLGDGTTLAGRQARMLPGLLAGDDVVHAIATGYVRGRFVSIDAATTTANRRDLIEPMRALAAGLHVDGDGVPKALADPGD